MNKQEFKIQKLIETFVFEFTKYLLHLNMELEKIKFGI